MTSTLHIVGSGSFIAKNVLQNFQNNESINLISRQDIDLTDPKSQDLLRSQINSEDDVMFFSGKVPCKNVEDYTQNIAMAKNLVTALSGIPLNFFGYVSSDAVYDDSSFRINESFPTTSNSLHGLMHLSRELIFRHELNVNRFLCVRPTLIYGRDDPHNGYGPNRFIRQIRSQNFIEVVGDGEELRDHIYVGDVANLFYMLYVGGNSGFFNLCTGKESSFRSLANETLRISESAKLVNLVRFGPIPHNGYRALDNSALLTVFPDYKFLKYSDFVDRMIKESGLTNGY